MLSCRGILTFKESTFETMLLQVVHVYTHIIYMLFKYLLLFMFIFIYIYIYMV